MLPRNNPTTIVKPLTSFEYLVHWVYLVIKHLVSSPLDDKDIDDKYYTALSKQPHSNKKVLFISAKVFSFMVQTENKSQHKIPLMEHTSPIRTTSEKLSYTLNNRTLRDITQLLDP